MEALYLLCSIISTTVTSVVLSIILIFRRFLTPRAAIDFGDHVTVYQGMVWHERRRPVHHFFQYSVRYAFIDLEHAPNVPLDHLTAVEARQISETNGPVFLLTIPPSVGYEQNPLSLYYCYDIEGPSQNLSKCIAEVTNTPWGERVLFLFDPNSDLVAKPLHVSPFMDMLGNWSIKASVPGANLSVVISVQHPELGNYFTASVTAKRVPSQIAGDQAWFFWLMPHKVALWIYWHALKLWWKNVPFIEHPRYHSPAYRDEALLRDRKLQCCGSSEPNKGSHQQVNGIGTHEAELDVNNRCFTWRDAKWPWC